MMGSRFTNADEANYSLTERDLLAVVYALLYGACPQLLVETHHKPILDLLSNKYLLDIACST